MAQVHFVAPENRNPAGGYRAACGKLYRPGYMVGGRWFPVTEKQAEVDCPKCAAAIGVELKPVEKKAGSEGTCQCCFNTQKTPKGKLSHHGYKAPGHGYHVGQCRGERELPFEKSCDVTKKWRSEVEGWIERRTEYLELLESGVIDSLPYEVTDYEAPRVNGRRPTKTVTIRKGDAASYGARESLPSFETRLASEIRSVKLNVEAGRRQVAFLDEKIAGWRFIA